MSSLEKVKKRIKKISTAEKMFFSFIAEYFNNPISVTKPNNKPYAAKPINNVLVLSVAEYILSAANCVPYNRYLP